MTASPLKTDVYTDFQGLSALRAQARSDRDASLREVAGQFEALFIQMMLKSMRDAQLGDGLLDNDQTATYQSMFDRQIAIDMSKGRGIGLSDMIVRQLGGAGISTSTADVDDADDRSPTGRSLPDAPVSERGPQLREVPDWRPASAEAFVRDLWPHARQAGDALGVKPEAILAQAALETGWGKHMIRGGDGRNSFNLFGIKADSRWTGERVTTETIEHRDGLVRKERAHFRAYPSLAASCQDYVKFIKDNSRYQKALDAGDSAPAFAKALAGAGYATDPEYSQKINQIMSGERLRHALGDIKDS